MIREVIRLVRPGVFEPFFVEKEVRKGQIVVKPTFLSICAADLRYFNGHRSSKVLRQKLPMALIHEAVGRVVIDTRGLLESGTQVILSPLGDDCSVGDNYKKDARFRSSNCDGFMQEFMILDPHEIIPYKNSQAIYYVFVEMLGVCFQAMKRVRGWGSAKAVGVWGDGVVGYLLSYIIKKEFPDKDVFVIGKHEEKLTLFSHVDRVYNILEAQSVPAVNIAFECVGGVSSTTAIKSILFSIRPGGCVCLMGVSEGNVPINTRLVLEKGVDIRGSSRCDLEDMIHGKNFLDKSEGFSWLEKMISRVVKNPNLGILPNIFKTASQFAYKTIVYHQ